MKHIYVDEILNKRVMFSESEDSLNDDDAIDASGVTEG